MRLLAYVLASTCVLAAAAAAGCSDDEPSPSTQPDDVDATAGDGQSPSDAGPGTTTDATSSVCDKQSPTFAQYRGRVVLLDYGFHVFGYPKLDGEIVEETDACLRQLGFRANRPASTIPGRPRDEQLDALACAAMNGDPTSRVHTSDMHGVHGTRPPECPSVSACVETSIRWTFDEGTARTGRLEFVLADGSVHDTGTFEFIDDTTLVHRPTRSPRVVYKRTEADFVCAPPP